MAERPILFSDAMVRAILAGTKTQTRRRVRGAFYDWSPIQPEWYAPTVVDRHGEEHPGPQQFGAGDADGACWFRCPYGAPGDRLWVREAFNDDRAEIIYRADGGLPGDWCDAGSRWRPSIHMPRAASRITLEVLEVRVERLQDISEADARAEGYELGAPPCTYNPLGWYRRLWEQINGPGSWEANPWVWCVSFRRVEA